jgi:hypothetical protein
MLNLTNDQVSMIVNLSQSLSKVKQTQSSRVNSKEHQINRLIYDVLTPAVQNSLEIYIKIHYKHDNIADFFEQKNKLIAENDHLRVVKYLLNSFSWNQNDLKLFDLNSCCAIARNILNLKCDKGWKVENLNEYSSNDLRNLKFGDVINCSKLLKRNFFNRTNLVLIDDAFFKNFMIYLNGLLDHLNISKELKEIKESILKEEIQLNDRFDQISFIRAGQMSATFKVHDTKYKKIRYKNYLT